MNLGCRGTASSPCPAAKLAQIGAHADVYPGTRQPQTTPMGRRLKPLARSLPFTKIVVSCEHATNAVPRAYAHLFRSAAAKKALNSHRGWDPGAAPLARAIARAFHTSPILGTHSRLVCDLNRSPWNRRGGVTSEFMSPLSEIERAMLIDRLHTPHWQKIEALVSGEIEAGGVVLHLGVHSFTPVLNGEVRTADFALLYDPRRPLERVTCDLWIDALRDAHVADGGRRSTPSMRVRRNYPYLGTADGLTTRLRKRFPLRSYAGIEIEMNQALMTRQAIEIGAARTGVILNSLRVALGVAKSQERSDRAVRRETEGAQARSPTRREEPMLRREFPWLGA